MAPVLLRTGLGLRGLVIVLGLRACRSVVEVVLLLLPLPLLLLLLLYAGRGRRGSSPRARCF